MSKTYAELLEVAEQIRQNELPESNTHDLVGGLLRDLITYLQSNPGISDKQIQELKDLINTVSSRIDKLVGDNASQAIDNFNEIINFLDGIKDSDSLAALLADINARIGTKATSESCDGSVWGELISLSEDGMSTSEDVSTLQVENTRKHPARFDRIEDSLLHIEGVTSQQDGEIVFASANKKFCYVIDDRAYANWPGAGDFFGSDNKIYPGKIYLCRNKAYVYWGGNLYDIGAADQIASVSYDNIDTVMTGGIYRVYDSDSVTHDIMFVTYSSEHGVTKQTYISTNPDFPIPGLAYRTYDGEKWSDWQEIGGDFQKILDDEIKARKKGDDNLRDAMADHSTVRFDKIVTDASVVIEGVTDVDGGQIVYVRSKQKFACFLDDKYYLEWPTSDTFMSADNKVLTDKVYLCENKAYIYYAGALLPVDEGAMALAISASASANAALEKLKTINAMKSVAIDQLDDLNDPENLTSHYTVLCQDHPVGTLCCFTNSKFNIITQILDANWDIDVSGQLLPEYAGVLHKSLIRVYNYDSDELDAEIPKKTWGKWKYNQKVITLEGGIIIE